MTDLRFQTLRNITYGGQRVNKVLLKSILALVQTGFRVYLEYGSLIVVVGETVSDCIHLHS